jgi:hypothetical protein
LFLRVGWFILAHSLQMNVLDQIVAWLGLVLQVGIAAILWSKRLYRRFPLFAAYTVYSIAVFILRYILLVTNSRLFVNVYWITDALYIILGLVAIYEAFKEAFRPLYPIWWFRLLVYLVILVPLGISVVAILRTPSAEVDRTGAAILLVQIGTRYVQGGIFALAFVVIRFFHLPVSRYASGIIDGFGVNALGILAGSILRSAFGTNYNTFFRFAPVVGYIIALLIWLTSLAGDEDENENGNGWEPDVPLELLPGNLRQQIDSIRKMRKQKRK